MPRAKGNAALDREIRREIGNMLWCLANGERIRPDVRMSSAQRSAIDQPTVDLIELYEKSADCVLTDLYEDWQQIQNSDRSADHFAYMLVGEAFDMIREAGFESLLKGGHPTFAIEMHGGELTWNGELREPEPTRRRRNPSIPSQEDYLGETLGAPTLNPGEAKHWYVFYTPFGRTAPKQYQGPFTMESSARTAMAQDIKKYSASADGYQLKHLTDDEFKAIWGASPTSNPPAGWRKREVGGGYQAPDEAIDVGNLRTVVYPKDGTYRDEMRGSMTRMIEHGDPFQRNPACPGCGAHIAIGAATCPACGIRVRAGAGAVATPKDPPRALGTRHGRPPGVPNPGHKFIGGHVSVWPRRTPTVDEMAAAYSYCLGEYRFPQVIDGEMWAEGLAFSGALRDLGPAFRATDVDRAEVRQFMSQLTDYQWQEIAARADYLRFQQGDPPRFAP